MAMTTRSGSRSSKIKLPLVGSVSYLAAAVGAAAIYYMWPVATQSYAFGIPARGALPGGK